jgi:beta-1,4-mannosyltransferase
MKQAFEAQVDNLHMSHVMITTAWLAFADYPRLLGVADVGISMHSSSSGLDLPMKIVDMFGCGLPALSVDYDCIKELVKPGRTGLLFNSGQQLCQHLVTLLTDFPQNEKLQQMHNNVVKTYNADSNRWHPQWQKLIAPYLNK